MGDAFSLEQRLQLGESVAHQEKLEITLLNLVIPLLLLLGSGRKVNKYCTGVEKTNGYMFRMFPS